ncbi:MULTISPECIES: helicase-exonuclease AddAB subunit AddB [Paenibacillus]|uniref:ATP-dependent helicase/deoxyribonuclease subunit B n=1 Tax=Paenibacillus lactis TaxID=228574 RepID=A0ABS4FFV3_9BACL|nr:helicase-exonuclease AddAB subunit AddB [Paenibacillus lactis]MBP1895139.1 ATP-dependent helicase/nuclease subunit B [Paenibacillus lactis]HAF99833.1 helicase-exonuclease AddAB subunit AddB [Paenibacillus lactis]
MRMQFIIGRSGSGKSTAIREEMSRRLEESPQGNPMILIVPEQGSFEAEHALVNTGGIKGIFRAQVLSLRRLAYRVMQETGGAAKVAISEEGKRMLLYKILRRRKEELELFGPSGEQLGFVGKLSELYTEMKRYCIDAACVEEQLELLTSHTGGPPMLQRKLKEIALIFRDYELEISRLYMDEEDTLATLAESIADSDYIRHADIWIDGFHGFTPQEYRVIRELLAHARQVTIALTLDKPYPTGGIPHELDLFHPTASTYIKLKGIADELGADTEHRMLAPEVPPRFSERPVLAHLERGYDRRMRWRGEAGTQADGLRLYAAANRRAEIEGAIREMLRLAQEEGARYRDMAVFVRNLGDYEHLIGPLFREYGIPYFLDQKRSELHHPVVEFVRSALDVSLRRWRYEDVFRCVKTDLLLPLDGSLSREDMDRLENHVLASGIQGSRWTDGRPWKGAPSLSLEEGETKARGTEELQRIEYARAAVASVLHPFEKRLKKAATAREQCTAVFRLLEEADVPEKLELLSRAALEAGRPEEAREHRQVWGAVLGLLDQIVEMMGDEKLSTELFAGILDTGLTELKMALVPPSLDQVLIGSMDRTRTGGVKYAFLLGVNDGVLPAQFEDDGILTEQERSGLAERGLELAPTISRRLLDERFLIYNALTTASMQLWVSYPAADDEGKTLLPSEVIRHLKLMFQIGEGPLASRPHAGQSPEEQAGYVTRPGKTIAYLTSRLRDWRNGEELPDLWWHAYNWFAGQPEWKTRLGVMLSSLTYRNEGRNLTEKTSRRLYGVRLATSVSRMERFVACPFSHFASHGLKLRERQLYRLQAPDIGQLFHAALSQMAVKFQSEHRSWGDLTAEECLREAEQTVDRLAPMLQGEILLSSKRYGYISRKLKNIVGRASVILGEQARRGKFEPVGLELDFGPGKPLPPLTFELDNGVKMEVVGRIDRVDMARGEHGVMLRVIDYKSSQKDLRLHEVYYGLSLQMLTYLDVLLTYAELWIGEQALPAGTLYFHVHDPVLQSANGMTPEAAAEELLKRYKMKGLLLADREAVSLMDSYLEKGHSAILPVAVKADGSFYSSAAVATPEQWETLLAAVRRNMTTIGSRITGGDVAIEPYRIQQETACTYCAYRPVCQFDDTIEGSQYQLLGKPGRDQVWDLLGQMKGEEAGGKHDG